MCLSREHFADTGRTLEYIEDSDITISNLNSVVKLHKARVDTCMIYRFDPAKRKHISRDSPLLEKDTGATNAELRAAMQRATRAENNLIIAMVFVVSLCCV